MTGGELLVLVAIEATCGAAAGVASDRWRGARLGPMPGALAGAIGGVVLAWLAGFVPWLARFVGHVETAVDRTMSATGGLTPTVLVGAGIAGLLGGLIASAVAGLVVRRRANMT